MIKKYLTEVNGCLCGMFDDFDDATHNALDFDTHPDDVVFVHEVLVEPAELSESNILIDTNLGYFVHVETPRTWNLKSLKMRTLKGSTVLRNAVSPASSV